VGEASERERAAAWIEDQAMRHARAHYGEDDDEVPAMLTLAGELAQGICEGRHMGLPPAVPMPLCGEWLTAGPAQGLRACGTDWGWAADLAMEDRREPVVEESGRACGVVRQWLCDAAAEVHVAILGLEAREVQPAQREMALRAARKRAHEAADQAVDRLAMRLAAWPRQLP
jgi:hypothetical protein